MCKRFIKQVLVLTLLSGSLSSFGFDLPWGQKKYTKESCHAFIPRTEQQKNFIWNLCEFWFDGTTYSPGLVTRNVCLRQNMEKAKNNAEAKEVIFNCFKKVPGGDNSAVLNIFNTWFPSTSEQQESNLNRRLPIPQATECTVIGNKISCF